MSPEDRENSNRTTDNPLPVSWEKEVVELFTLILVKIYHYSEERGMYHSAPWRSEDHLTESAPSLWGSGHQTEGTGQSLLPAELSDWPVISGLCRQGRGGKHGPQAFLGNPFFYLPRRDGSFGLYEESACLGSQPGTHPQSVKGKSTAHSPLALSWLGWGCDSVSRVLALLGFSLQDCIKLHKAA